MKTGKDKDREYIIRLAAETAVKAYKAEVEKEKKERADRRLHNTKLLLKNYRMFKAHAENAVYDAAAIDENAIDILDLMSDRMDDNEVFVNSIKQSVMRTVTIVSHIDAMLRLYEIYCNQSNDTEERRRWQVVYGLYVDEQPKTVKWLANEHFVTERTIYRDIDAGCEKLAALIFGIDGIKKR